MALAVCWKDHYMSSVLPLELRNARWTTVTFKVDVGNGMAALVFALKTDRDDADTVNFALEALLIVCTAKVRVLCQPCYIRGQHLSPFRCLWIGFCCLQDHAAPLTVQSTETPPPESDVGVMFTEIFVKNAVRFSCCSRCLTDRKTCRFCWGCWPRRSSTSATTPSSC